jgi:hypothetical protein
MKKVTATVLYPVEVSFDLQSNSTLDQIWEDILDEADNKLNLKETSPVIYSCSERDLLESNKLQPLTLDSQEDWKNNTLQSLSNANKLLSQVSNGKVFFKNQEQIDVKINVIKSLMSELLENLNSSD